MRILIGLIFGGIVLVTQVSAAETVRETPRVSAAQPAPGAADGSVAREQVSVDLVVRIGGKVYFMSRERMVYGATPADVLERRFKVVRGKVCSDPREVWAVDGYATNHARGRFWSLRINGSYADASPFASIVQDGDVVEWEWSGS